jgi:hypothetical protein
MKKAMIGLMMAVFAVAGLFAQEDKGFSVIVDIDADLVEFKHTEIKNDEYISDEDTIQPDQVSFMHGSSFSDAELKFSYTDPDQNFGGVIGLDIADALTGTMPWGDFYGWVNVTRFARVQLGKYTYRAIEKIGGDKDLGVLSLDLDKAANTLQVNTSDSLAQQASVVGFLGQALIGPAEIGVFAAPDAYFVARHFQVPGTATGAEPEQTIPAYYAYNFGTNLKLALPELLDAGLSFRQIHTEGVNSSTGEIYNDFGLYTAINALRDLGLRIGAGYSFRIAYEDGDDPSTAALRNSIHLDIVYSGIPNLNAGLYNNVSFYSLAAENLPAYDPAIAQVANVYADEFSLVLYNELEVSYELPNLKLTPGLVLRNYYAVLDGRNGVKGADYGMDTFSVEAKAAYKVSERAEFRAGLKFTNTVYDTPKVSDVLVNSNFAVAIPVGLTLKW